MAVIDGLPWLFAFKKLCYIVSSLSYLDSQNNVSYFDASVVALSENAATDYAECGQATLNSLPIVFVSTLFDSLRFTPSLFHYLNVGAVWAIRALLFLMPHFVSYVPVTLSNIIAWIKDFDQCLSCLCFY